MIEGVRTRELKKNVDDRGYLMEVLRRDWPDVFRSFGQAYVSLNYPGVIRAWHWHERQWDVFVCVSGMIKAPLYDGRDGSSTRGEVNEFVIGEHRPLAILIPPGVYHGYLTIGTVPSLLLNFPTELYDGSDERRLAFNDPSIPYHWEVTVR